MKKYNNSYRLPLRARGRLNRGFRFSRTNRQVVVGLLLSGFLFGSAQADVTPQRQRLTTRPAVSLVQEQPRTTRVSHNQNRKHRFKVCLIALLVEMQEQRDSDPLDDCRFDGLSAEAFFDKQYEAAVANHTVLDLPGDDGELQFENAAGFEPIRERSKDVAPGWTSRLNASKTRRMEGQRQLDWQRHIALARELKNARLMA